MNWEKLADTHVKGFLFGQGFVDPHAEYLEKNFQKMSLKLEQKHSWQIQLHDQFY